MNADVRAYQPGQILWALWRTFSQYADDANDAPPPGAFASRIRKLGDFGVPVPVKQRPGRPGIDLELTAAQGFEIAVGLAMQDTGLKQSEVAFFLRNIRRELQRTYRLIMESPPAPGMNILARDRPKSPARMVIKDGDPQGLGDPHRSSSADTSVYMTFRYVEIKEAWHGRKFEGADWGGKADPPFFFRPKFHRGLAELHSEMEWLSNSYQDRIRIVIELSNLAVLVTNLLDRAPTFSRGRKRAVE